MDNKPKIEPHSWTGPEYDHTQKNIDWLWTVGLISIIGFILTIIFKSYVFGIFILVSGGTLIFFSIRNPQELSFTLTDESIVIEGKDFPYKKLKGFKIKENESGNKLLIMTDAHFLPVITLPIPKDASQNAYNILIQFIPELNLEESPSMKFMEKLGF